MKANEFVNNLKTLLLSRERIKELRKKGVNEATIALLNDRFDIKKVNFSNDIKNALFDLINNYNASKIKIATISFLDKIFEDENYYYIGEEEADELIMDKTTGIIKVKEYNSDYIISECAQNGEKFLDALFLVASFLEKRVNKMGQNQKTINAIAFECAELAGGDQFLSFYKYILGSEE